MCRAHKSISAIFVTPQTRMSQKVIKRTLLAENDY